MSPRTSATPSCDFYDNAGTYYVREDYGDPSWDGDNLPEANWQFPELEGCYAQIPEGCDIVNIYSLFTRQPIWPRGFPLTRITAPESTPDPATLTSQSVRIGIWQALADDDPDVDAIYRLTSNTPCRFTRRAPVVLPPQTFSPFNSQNTAFRRELLPLMYLPALVNFRVTELGTSFGRRRPFPKVLATSATA